MMEWERLPFHYIFPIIKVTVRRDGSAESVGSFEEFEARRFSENQPVPHPVRAL
jgi:hypothetical protein